MADYRENVGVADEFLRNGSRARPVGLIVARENAKLRAVDAAAAVYLVDGKLDPATAHHAVALLPRARSADNVCVPTPAACGSEGEENQ